MPEITCQDPRNIYKMARNGVGKSRLDAAYELHLSDRTLARYELDESVPSPDVVDAMAVLYAARDLTAVYCSDICPNGKPRPGIAPVNKKTASQAANKILKQILSRRRMPVNKGD